VNVSSEEKDPRSLFSLYKKLITLKKHNAVLREGKYIPLPQPAETIFAYMREKDGKKLLILANLTHKDREISLQLPKATVVCDTAFLLQEGEKIDLTKCIIKGNEGYILSITD
jgi:glycosidase